MTPKTTRTRPRNRHDLTRRLRKSGGKGLIPALVLLACVGGVTVTAVVIYLQSQASARLVKAARREASEKQVQLERTQEQMRQTKAKYERYMANLVGSQRAAEVIVEDQTQDEDGQIWTKIKFLEYSVDGQPLEPVKVFTVPGNVVYFDALVMRYTPEQVQEGKAKSLYLFRRVFTDETRPDMGYKLFDADEEASPPKNLQADTEEIPIQAQQQVWARFQKCLSDPEHAKEQGVDTMYGEAVYDTLRKGYLYTLNIQNNGGLELRKKQLSSVLR